MVVALYDSGSSVRVELADGASDNFDLVVCADVYMSLGRQTLFSDVGLKYAGYVLWRGLLAEGGMPRAETLEHDIACIGYPDGHSLFYFVPGANGSIKRGERLFNWGMYLPVADEALADFLTDRAGHRREGSLPSGAVPLATERAQTTRRKNGCRTTIWRLPSEHAIPQSMRSTTASCPPIARDGFAWSEMRGRMRDRIVLPPRLRA